MQTRETYPTKGKREKTIRFSEELIFWCIAGMIATLLIAYMSSFLMKTGWF